MVKKYIDQEAKKLFLDIVPRLKPKDAEDFFDSLLSSAETKDISRRLLAAKKLFEKSTYEDIQEEMGMSSGTTNKIRFKTKGSPIFNRLFKKD